MFFLVPTEVNNRCKCATAIRMLFGSTVLQTGTLSGKVVDATMKDAGWIEHLVTLASLEEVDFFCIKGGEGGATVERGSS